MAPQASIDKNKPKFCNWPQLGLITALTLFITACATTDTEAPLSTETSVQSEDQTLPVKGLAPRVLRDGECGLFVWTGEEKTFSLFSQNGTTARFSYDGEERSLTTSGTSILDQYGQAPEQILTDRDNNEYKLSLAEAETIEKGIQYRQGRLSFKNDEGWYVVQSAFGVSTCLTNSSSKESLLFKAERNISD